MDYGSGDAGNYIAHSSGMFFDQYGMVYIALSNYGTDSEFMTDSDNGNIEEYAPRFAIAGYSVQS